MDPIPDNTGDVPHEPSLQPGWVALAAALEDLLSRPDPWPAGKTTFQKLAYFLTAAGVPTGLAFARGTYGPYAPGLTDVTLSLIQNDLLGESPLGSRMIQLQLGDAFPAARTTHEHELAEWQDEIHRAADLLARLHTRDAEIAATVHLVATEATAATGEAPAEETILAEALKWQPRKNPPLNEDEILNAIHGLAELGWLELTHGERTGAQAEIDESALVGA